MDFSPGCGFTLGTTYALEEVSTPAGRKHSKERETTLAIQ